MSQQQSQPNPAFAPYAALPLPQSSWDNHEFWEFCKRHELRVQRCSDCGSLRYYPRPACPDCHSMRFEWARMSGKGAVYSYTIAYHPVLPYFADKVPLPVAVVKLEEGNVFMVGRLMDVPPEEVRIDMPVEVVFEDVAEDISLPQWRRASTG
ncbi:MAG: Zn-ribbon domain-containing OB-fold protein [Dehalococcoidia bacterium]